MILKYLALTLIIVSILLLLFGCGSVIFCFLSIFSFVCPRLEHQSCKMAWCSHCMSSDCPCVEDDEKAIDPDWYEEPEIVPMTEREMWEIENKILDRE